MIQVVYYNDWLRCYRDGKVERFWRGLYWREVKNTANHSNGYNKIIIDDDIYRHRIIAFCWLGLENIVGGDDTNDIDHIDGNKLNNHADNLRVVSNQQNGWNRINAKGYTWNKNANKWQAQIKVNGKDIYLGYFTEEASARQAYLAAKLKYHVIT